MFLPPQDSPKPARQRGMVLVVSLIILVIVTLIAVTALRVTVLEERMAGNTRDRQLAFEAAEYALRDAQRALEAPVVPKFSSTGGDGGAYVNLDTNVAGVSEVTYWSSKHDWSTKSVQAAKTDGVLAGQTQPRYVMEEFAAIACDGYSKKWPPPPPRNVYRITARGVGRTDDAVVILQTWFDRGCS